MAVSTDIISLTTSPDRDDQHGIVLQVRPPEVGPSTDRTFVKTWGWEIQRKTTASTGWTTVENRVSGLFGGGITLFKDKLPADDITRQYRGRAKAEGYVPGDWSNTVSAKPVPLSQEISVVLFDSWANAETKGRTDSLYSTDGILKGNVVQTDTVSNRAMIRGREIGQTLGGSASSGGSSWSDAAAITFQNNYENVPNVSITNTNGIASEPDATKWTSSADFNSAQGQRYEIVPLDVTVSGFTPRGRLVQKTTPSKQTLDFSTNNSLTAEGDTVALTLTSAPADNDQYTANWDVTVDKTSTGGIRSNVTVQVAVDTNTTGGWVQRDTVPSDFVFNGSSTGTLTDSNVSNTVGVTGVVSTDQLRIRFLDFTVSAGPFAGSTLGDHFTVDIHGHDGSVDGSPAEGVSFIKSTSQLYASLTPTSNTDYLTWTAEEYQTGD